MGPAGHDGLSLFPGWSWEAVQAPHSPEMKGRGGREGSGLEGTGDIGCAGNSIPRPRRQAGSPHAPDPQLCRQQDLGAEPARTSAPPGEQTCARGLGQAAARLRHTGEREGWAQGRGAGKKGTGQPCRGSACAQGADMASCPRGNPRGAQHLCSSPSAAFLPPAHPFFTQQSERSFKNST